MVYFSNGQITIRNMEYGDAQIITDAEIEQGWDASIEKYLKRIEDQRLGNRHHFCIPHLACIFCLDTKRQNRQGYNHASHTSAEHFRSRCEVQPPNTLCPHMFQQFLQLYPLKLYQYLDSDIFLKRQNQRFPDSPFLQMLHKYYWDKYLYIRLAFQNILQPMKLPLPVFLYEAYKYWFLFYSDCKWNEKDKGISR